MSAFCSYVITLLMLIDHDNGLVGDNDDEGHRDYDYAHDWRQ